MVNHMHIKNTHKNADPEIINYISEHIDNDIDCLLEDKPLNMGDRKVPEFDEYKVYQNILNEVNKRKKRKIWPAVRWACAIALLLFNISYFTYQYVIDYKPVYQEVYASKGEKLVVLLADGSRVWLNADSKLVYPDKFGGDERKVSLVGEAYFEIKKNSKMPFIVSADEMRIKVTGTKFNVSAYPSDKDITATLDEGKISIGSSQNNSSLLEMFPGQTAVYERESNKCKIRTNEYYKEDSNWKENRLAFRNTSLQDVLNVLSRQFNVTFSVNDTQIKSFTYTFVSKNNDLGNILETIESITPVQFKKTSDGVYIARRK
ncbi:anti-sigma factor [Bacteroides sedimenti]|uniref:Anti-sigma factor n=2 Tax=Bacteroides sedimenti TaxID=2136147 RepID=A0ABN6Z9L8_9BACE